MPTKSTYRAVNLLFLVVLLLQLVNFAFMWLPQYVRMILNEALFVFLPAYLFLRLRREPLVDRVRWRWPGWRIAGLSLLVGMGLYPLSAVSAGILQQLLGYAQVAMPDDVIPRTVLMGVLAIVAYAVMAPVCEEFLFRGVIQPVYEQRGATWAVLFVGALFVVFHLSLLQGLSIIALALALGFVNARTRSLLASILTHVGANALAALVLTNDVFGTGVQQVLFSAPVLVASPVVALVALIALVRLTRRTEEPSPVPQPVERRLTLAAGWPLLVASAIYLLMTGAEVYMSRLPGQAAEPLTLNAADWEGTPSWQYEIRNPADDVVGDGACHLIQESSLVSLTCSSTVIAYEVTIGNSFWSSSGGERTDQFTWNAGDGRLVAGKTILDLQEGAYFAEIAWTVEEGGIRVQSEVRVDAAGVDDDAAGVEHDAAGDQDGDFYLPWSEAPLAENGDASPPVLTDYAAPWQLATARLEPGERGQALRFHPFTWRQETQDNGPVTAPWAVTVVGREEVGTPAGPFDAWRVTFGDHQVVWFDDSSSPATPVQFYNGTETWSLK